jgi:hypothetical protein
VVAAEHAQFNPVIVPTSDHQFIIVYRDNRFDEQGDLYTQKLSADGQLLWQAEGVPICTAVAASSNVIAVKDNFGGAFITWKDYRSGVVSIFVQHIDSSGNSLWTPDGICPASNDPKTVHSVIQDGGDGCLISYNNQVTGYGGEFVQRLGADGLPLWASPLSIGNDTDTMYEDDCRLALLNSNEFVATWWNSTGEQTDILIQRYNTAGQAVWALPISLNLPPADNVYLENTALADDGIFIAYYRVDGTTTALCLQKLSLSGQLLWNEQNTHCGAVDYIYYQNVSRIVPDLAGGCYIAWQEWNQETSDHNVRAQHISTAGVKTWAVEGVQLAQVNSIKAYRPWSLLPDACLPVGVIIIPYPWVSTARC